MVILIFVLLILCSASAMADSYNFTENAIVDTMTISLSPPLNGTATLTGFTDNGWNIIAGNETNAITVGSVGGAVAPDEFSLSFDSLPAGSTIAFAAYYGGLDGTIENSATIGFDGSTWTVLSNTGPGDVAVSTPEPSLSLLLGLSLGAAALTLGWKKG